MLSIGNSQLAFGRGASTRFPTSAFSGKRVPQSPTLKEGQEVAMRKLQEMSKGFKKRATH